MTKLFTQCMEEAMKIRGAKQWNPELDNLSSETIEAIISKVVIELDLVKEDEVKTTPATIKRAEAFVQKWDLIAEAEAKRIEEEEIEAAKEASSGLGIVDEFLQLWKDEAFKYYVKLRNELLVERSKKHEITIEGLKLLPKDSWGGRKFSDEQIVELMEEVPTMESRRKERLESDISYRQYNAWKARHSKAEIGIVDSLYGKDGGVSMLHTILDKEVVRKKKALISRVEESAGTILDASKLTIGDNAEINGWVRGEKKTVYVQTIYAGGYNIQVLHYRVLVK